MADKSAIAWTDATWNPLRGCTKVSPGCAHCYAETFAERFRGVPGHPYEQGFDLRLVPEKLTEPLRWKKPRRVFVNSMSDLLQDGVPDSYIDQVFAVMALAPQHTFQVLTKRAERMRAYVNHASYTRIRRIVDGEDGENEVREAWWKTLTRLQRESHQTQWWTELKWERWPLPNVWLGVSVENQHFADERIPLLLQTPSAVRFISGEPLLEGLDLRNWLALKPPCERTLDWVIVGGESGYGARPFDVGWARSIIGQCKAAGVPCFVKQLGAATRDAAASRDDMGARDVWPAGAQHPDGRWVPIIGSRKGDDPAEWPADLQVQQFPTIEANP